MLALRLCAFVLEMLSLKRVYTAEICCVLIAVSPVVSFFVFFVPKSLKVSIAPMSLHVACESKVNTHPLLSLLSFSSSLLSAIHTSNYRVCDGYYNTDLPG